MASLIKDAYRTKTYGGTLTAKLHLAWCLLDEAYGTTPYFRPEGAFGTASISFPGGSAHLTWGPSTQSNIKNDNGLLRWVDTNELIGGGNPGDDYMSVVCNAEFFVGGDKVFEAQLDEIILDYRGLTEAERQAIVDTYAPGDRIETHIIEKTMTFSVSGDWDLMGEVLLSNDPRMALDAGHPDNSATWDRTRNTKLSERGPNYDSNYELPYSYSWSVNAAGQSGSGTKRFSNGVNDNISVSASAGWTAGHQLNLTTSSSNYVDLQANVYMWMWRQNVECASVSWSEPGLTSLPSGFNDTRSETQRTDQSYTCWCNVSGRSISVGGYGDYFIDPSQGYKGAAQYTVSEYSPQHVYKAYFDDYDMDANPNVWGAVANVDASNKDSVSVAAGGAATFNYTGKWNVYRAVTPTHTGGAWYNWPEDTSLYSAGGHVGPLQVTNTEALDQPHHIVTEPYYKLVADNRVPVTASGAHEIKAAGMVKVSPDTPGEWFDFVSSFSDLIAGSGLTLAVDSLGGHVNAAAQAGSSLSCTVFPKPHLNGCRYITLQLSADHPNAQVKLRFGDRHTYTVTLAEANVIYTKKIDLMRPDEFMTPPMVYEDVEVELPTPIEFGHFPYEANKDVIIELESPKPNTSKIRLIFDKDSVSGAVTQFAETGNPETGEGDYLAIYDPNVGMASWEDAIDIRTGWNSIYDPFSEDPYVPISYAPPVNGNKILLHFKSDGNSADNNLWGCRISRVKVTYSTPYAYGNAQLEDTLIDVEKPCSQYNEHQYEASAAWGVDIVESMNLQFVTAGNFDIYDISEVKNTPVRLLLAPQGSWNPIGTGYHLWNAGKHDIYTDAYNFETELFSYLCRSGIALVDGKISAEFLNGKAVELGSGGEEWVFHHLRLFYSGVKQQPWVRPFDSLPLINQAHSAHEHVNNTLAIDTFSTGVCGFIKAYGYMDCLVTKPVAQDVDQVVELDFEYQSDLVSCVTPGQFTSLTVRGRKVWGAKVVGVLYHGSSPAVNAQIKLQTGIGTTHERTEILQTDSYGYFESSGKHICMGEAELGGIPINLTNRHHHAFVLVGDSSAAGSGLLLYDTTTGKLHYRPATGRLEYGA